MSSDDVETAQPVAEEPAPEEPAPEEPAPEDAQPEEPAPEEPSPASIRERLVRQFESWVDQMLAGEPPPPGVPEELLDEPGATAWENPAGGEQDCDLYTLFAGLTALTGEVRLQGRAFKQLANTLAPLADLPGQIEQLAADQEPPEPDREADELPVSGSEVVEVMMDLYDRLERGLRTCDAGIAAIQMPGQGWLRRWAAGPTARQAAAAVEAIRDASELTLRRLETVLHDWGVERIGRPGDTFDPVRMTAVQVRPAAGAEPGTVLEVNRAGYAVRGRVSATAQVTVARAESIPGQIEGGR